MVKRVVLVQRIEKIEHHLKRATLYSRFSFIEFIEDTTAQDIVEYNLFQTVNHLIAMIEHIVADEQYGFPQTAYESAELLKAKKVLSAKDLALIRQMIGFRNIVGHEYIRLNKEIVYQILTKHLKDIRRLMEKIASRFLN